MSTSSEESVKDVKRLPLGEKVSDFITHGIAGGFLLGIVLSVGYLFLQIMAYRFGLLAPWEESEFFTLDELVRRFGFAAKLLFIPAMGGGLIAGCIIGVICLFPIGRDWLTTKPIPINQNQFQPDTEEWKQDIIEHCKEDKFDLTGATLDLVDHLGTTAKKDHEREDSDSSDGDGSGFFDIDWLS